jgi:hypothetical protein
MKASLTSFALLSLFASTSRAETMTAAAAPESAFKPSALIQTWYSISHLGTTSNTFRVRRAELSAKGDVIADRFGYTFMMDPAKLLEFQDTRLPVTPGDGMAAVTAKQPNGASSVLQDAYVTGKTAYADLSLGQFKIPVSWEGYNSSSKLLFHERAQVSSRFGDKRDIGVRAAKQWKHVGYTLGLFNGNGQNTRDTDTGKDGAARLELYPVDGLMVAGVVYSTLWNRSAAGAKDRYEGDLRFERGPLLFQGEYIQGKDVNKDGSKTRGRGFYAALAGRPLPPLQLAGRLGYLDPDQGKTSDHTWSYEAVINYYLRGQEARVALAYSHFLNAGPLRPDEDAVTLALQVLAQ